MVVEQETREAYLLERPHGGDHVDVALAQEALLEAGNRTLHIAEMHVDDLAARAKVANGFDDAGPHLGPAPHAEVEAAVGAGRNLHRPLEPLEVAEEPR